MINFLLFAAGFVLGAICMFFLIKSALKSDD
jgi:hypothetical protein